MARHRYTNEEIEDWRKKNHRIGYFNSDDSRIFVPKGIGFGVTVNWGNPVVYIAFAAIVIILVFTKI